VENTEQNRRDYRQLFYTAPGIGGHISGERSFRDHGFSAPFLRSRKGM
jgi:Fructose-bisphosphate aldolase class-I